MGSSEDTKGLPFEMLKFSDKEGRVIEWRDVRLRRAQSVCINIKKSKTDQFGKGRIVRHNRMTGKDCIVEELEIWVEFCRGEMGATPEVFVFQIGEKPLIRDAEVATVMKLVVV